jgi:hypothetical protein
MAVIGVIEPEETVDSEEQLAKTDHSNGYPGRAGYVGNADAYCNECVPEEFRETDRAILCSSEWDYPGASCCVCLKRLQTKVLVYDRHDMQPKGYEKE